MSIPLAYTALVCIATLWLCFRLYAVLKIPRSLLTFILGLEAPKQPKVTINQLTDTWASISWDPSPDVVHRIKINDMGAVDTSRTKDRLVLSDLLPSSEYTLNVWAIGANERFSTPFVLKFKTLAYAEEMVAAPVFSQGKTRVTQMKQEEGNINRQIENVISQKSEARKEFLATNAELENRLTSLGESLKSSEAARARFRHEIKAMEESKHSLEQQLAKSNRAHREVQDVYNSIHSAQDAWATEVSKYRSQIHTHSRELSETLRQKDLAKATLTNMIERRRATLAKAEENANDLATQVHEHVQVRESTLAFLKELKRHVRIGTGVIAEVILESTLSSSSLSQEDRELFRTDIGMDTHLESEWMNVMAKLEARYVTAYEAFRRVSTLTMDQQPATTPASTRSLDQVCIQSSQSLYNQSLSSLALSGTKIAPPAETPSSDIRPQYSRAMSSYNPWMNPTPLANPREKSMFFSGCNRSPPETRNSFDNRSLDNRSLDNRSLDRSFDNRSLDNRSLDTFDNRSLDNRSLENRSFEGHLPDNLPTIETVDSSVTAHNHRSLENLSHLANQTSAENHSLISEFDPSNDSKESPSKNRWNLASRFSKNSGFVRRISFFSRKDKEERDREEESLREANKALKESEHDN